MSLRPAFPKVSASTEVRYKMYVRGANGDALLGLHGISEFELAAVQRYDDDWYRAGLVGNVTYRAASSPLAIDQILLSGELSGGAAGGR